MVLLRGNSLPVWLVLSSPISALVGAPLSSYWDARQTTDCCSLVSESLPGKVALPAEQAFTDSISTYWSQQEQSIVPSCVVLPSTAEDVSAAVKVLGAANNSCKFAVKSGGHMHFAGAANIADGVTIDLSNLNWITPQANDEQVAVGPGQRWLHVYAALESIGKGVIGGRVGSVGVGGNVIGGGFSYFSTQQGFAADNALAFEVVLADGSIVTATQTAHHDLWLALKGGSNNFGIVTNYILRTFPLGDVWIGDVVYDPSTIDTQLAALHTFVKDPNYDVDAAVLPSFSFGPSFGTAFANQIVYAKPVANPPALQPFLDIQPQWSNSLAVQPTSAYVNSTLSRTPNGFQQATFATTFQNTLPILQKVFSIWNATLQDIAPIPGIAWSLSLPPIPQVLTNHSTSKGGNVLGLEDNPDSGLILALLSATWDSEGDSGVVNAVAEGLLEEIREAAREEAAFHPYVDLNHAAVGQDVFGSYGEGNLAALRAAGRKYDPRGVFQTKVPGGFKVGR